MPLQIAPQRHFSTGKYLTDQPLTGFGFAAACQTTECSRTACSEESAPIYQENPDPTESSPSYSVVLCSCEILYCRTEDTRWPFPRLHIQSPGHYQERHQISPAFSRIPLRIPQPVPVQLPLQPASDRWRTLSFIDTLSYPASSSPKKTSPDYLVRHS